VFTRAGNLSLSYARSIHFTFLRDSFNTRFNITLPSTPSSSVEIYIQLGWKRYESPTLLLENLKERGNLLDRGVDGKIILNVVVYITFSFLKRSCAKLLYTRI
jgi:hypothetical protein